MNEEKLLKFAIDYLSKYDSTKKNLLYVLKRKILRLQIPKEEKTTIFSKLNSVFEILEKNNFIDDNRYTFSKILSLSKQGKSKKYISNYLNKKGVNKSDIQNNFDDFQKNNNDWELNSANLFAKKKRLFESEVSYEKKLAKMARAGFSYDVCKKILG